MAQLLMTIALLCSKPYAYHSLPDQQKCREAMISCTIDKTGTPLPDQTLLKCAQSIKP